MNNPDRLLCMACLVILVAVVILPVSGALKTSVLPTVTTPVTQSGIRESQPANIVNFWIWTADGEFTVARASIYSVGRDKSRQFLGQADQNGYCSVSLPSGNTKIQVDSPVYSRNGKNWYYSGTSDIKVPTGNNSVEIRLTRKQTISPPPTVPVS